MWTFQMLAPKHRTFLENDPTWVHIFVHYHCWAHRLFANDLVNTFEYSRDNLNDAGFLLVMSQLFHYLKDYLGIGHILLGKPHLIEQLRQCSKNIQIINYYALLLIFQIFYLNINWCIENIRYDLQNRFINRSSSSCYNFSMFTKIKTHICGNGTSM